MPSLRATGSVRRAASLAAILLVLGATWLARDVESRPILLRPPPVTEAGFAPAAFPPELAPDDALRVLGAARGSRPLRSVLGTSAVRVLAAGPLVDGPRRVGTTMLLDLPVPRRGVSATVPDFGATAKLRASILRTVLVGVEARTGRVVAIEPGPGSVTTRWTGPAHVGVTAMATRDPLLVRFSPGGPSFLTYDGDQSLSPRARDWPVSLVFAGHATVGKVKAALRKVGFTHSGHRRYLAYRGRAGAALLDGDRGVKTGCDASSTDVHVRLYAPSAPDQFADPRLGSVVVGTVHFDRNDGCGTGPRLYGFSELAEQRVADVLSTRLGWRVERDRLALGNAEPLRVDVRNASHVWLADGRATLIHVP